MSRDKQIEEMARTMCFQSESCTAESCTKVNCEKTWLAENLYNAGYRKASDVAEEIFAEIGEIVNEYLDGRIYTHEFCTILAELKKKYTQGKAEIPPYVRMEAKALPATLNVKYTEEGK